MKTSAMIFAAVIAFVGYAAIISSMAAFAAVAIIAG
jgi:hypothetical protein